MELKEGRAAMTNGGFLENLDRETERAVHEINANLRALRAHSEARRGLFSIFKRKTGKYTTKTKSRGNKAVLKDAGRKRN